MKTRILFVEDEADLGNVVKQYLEIMDFEVHWHTGSVTALEQFRQHPLAYDILILDVSMPVMDGFELAEQALHLRADIPFLFLTARGDKKDKLHGLKIGADDYITKPFDIDELVLRVRNIIRRHHPDTHQAPPATAIRRHDVTFYKDTLRLRVGEKESTLTVREAELLEFLFRNENRILKREEILQQLWGENDYFLGRSLDVFISRLRKHLSASGKVAINNVYGVGFVFSC